jgi:hypothetical protein
MALSLAENVDLRFIHTEIREEFHHFFGAPQKNERAFKVFVFRDWKGASGVARFRQIVPNRRGPLERAAPSVWAGARI